MNSVLTPLLAMSAWFLGLSILVQVLQELWKFVTSSKARAYEKALADFLGPFVLGRLKQDPLLAVRGPLQFRRVSEAGKVMPLNADDLIASLEKTAPEWPRLIRRALDFEASTARPGVPFRPSPEFSLTVSKLKSQIAEAEFLEKNPEHRGLASELLSLGDAQRVRDFLETWHLLDFHEPSAAAFDASTIRQAFDRAFFPHTETITKHYDQFLKNFDYSYQRRNLRQTFLLSLLVAVVLNLPFEQIFMRATAITPEQAVALAENAQALYQQANAPTTPANEQQRLRELGNQALTIAKSATNFACGPRDSGLTPQDIIATEETDITQQGTSTNYVCDSAVTIDYFFNPRVLWERLYDPANGSPRFLFGCFLTAILITFGAPFWNDLSGALLRIARPAPAAEPSPTKSKQGAKTEEQ